MTTYEFVRPHVEQGRVRVGRFGASLSAAVGRVRALVLPVAGLSCLTGAAFEWCVPAGLVAAGVALFVLDYGAGKRASK